MFINPCERYSFRKDDDGFVDVRCSVVRALAAQFEAEPHPPLPAPADLRSLDIVDRVDFESCTPAMGDPAQKKWTMEGTPLLMGGGEGGGADVATQAVAGK